jgi:creatinine amidohydrolase/Fe(II)-dependent formamide hydrolase-like protein
MVSTASEDMHAGELEVSLLLHSYPELVDDGYRAPTGRPIHGHTCW